MGRGGGRWEAKREIVGIGSGERQTQYSDSIWKGKKQQPTIPYIYQRTQGITRKVHVMHYIQIKLLLVLYMP